MATLNLAKLHKALEGRAPSVANTLKDQAERFWIREIVQDTESYLSQVEREYARLVRDGRPADAAGVLAPAPLSPLATAAYGMLHCLALGAWQARRQVQIARKGAGLRESGRRATLAADWEQLHKRLAKVGFSPDGALELPEYIANELKFPAAFARTFGIQPEYAAGYVAERMPPIVDATAEMQTMVRDAVTRAGRAVWDADALRDELQRIGGISQARARNQMRTESATMFVRGRFESFSQDDAVIAWRFIVTQDEDTTDICRSHIGQVIAADKLQAIPPFHYQCRTEIVPIYRWEASKYPGLELGGDEQPASMDGFGQQEYVEQVKGRRAA